MIDIFVAGAVLVLLSPLLVLVALAVVLETSGGALYGASRVGEGERPFRMWKFRTMIDGAARVGPPITGRNDPRVTRLGRILRRTKLDELPQFLNVLAGHMTLVGPRPEAPGMVARYTAAQRAVLRTRPGITGRVQLESRDEEAEIPQGASADEYYVRCLMDRKLRRDLEYIDTRTPLTDLQIVVATAGLVLRSLISR